MSDLKTYKFKKVYGEDLTSIDPWFSNEYTWEPLWRPAFPDVTPESYSKNPKEYERRVREKNEAYIKELTDKGLLGKEYEVEMSIRHNPLFDDNKYPDQRPLESYRMKIIDFSKHDGTNNVEQVKNKKQ